MHRSIFIIFILNIFFVFLFFAAGMSALVFEFNERLAKVLLERLFVTPHVFKITAIFAFSLALISSAGLFYSASRSYLSLSSNSHKLDIDLNLVKRALQRHLGGSLPIENLFMKAGELQICLSSRSQKLDSDELSILELQIRNFLASHFDYGKSFHIHLTF